MRNSANKPICRMRSHRKRGRRSLWLVVRVRGNNIKVWSNSSSRTDSITNNSRSHWSITHKNLDIPKSKISTTLGPWRTTQNGGVSTCVSFRVRRRLRCLSSIYCRNANTNELPYSSQQKWLSIFKAHNNHITMDKSTTKNQISRMGFFRFGGCIAAWAFKKLSIIFNWVITIEPKYHNVYPEISKVTEKNRWWIMQHGGCFSVIPFRVQRNNIISISVSS